MTRKLQVGGEEGVVLLLYGVGGGTGLAEGGAVCVTRAWIWTAAHWVGMRGTQSQCETQLVLVGRWNVSSRRRS